LWRGKNEKQPQILRSAYPVFALRIRGPKLAPLRMTDRGVPVAARINPCPDTSCCVRCLPSGAKQAAEKLDFSKSAKNGPRQDDPGTIREGWSTVLHPPNLALSPSIRSFSAACLAPEGKFSKLTHYPPLGPLAPWATAARAAGRRRGGSKSPGRPTRPSGPRIRRRPETR